jgi:hypothetical protein
MGVKRIIQFIAAVGVAILIIGGDLIAQDQPDEIVIDNKGYQPERKGPVTFTHLNHAEDYEVACSDCHHVYQDGKNSWEEGDPVNKCIECHDPVNNQGDVKNLRLSFHKNCKNCHRQLAEAGISEDAPFRKCAGCHE